MPGPSLRKSIEPDSPLVVAPRNAVADSAAQAIAPAGSLKLRSEIQTRTCTIEDAAGSYGTGILVGSNLVLTNYHVIRYLFDPGTDFTKTFCRFDYFRDLERRTTHPGTCVGLNPVKDEWWLAFSEFSAQDDTGADSGFSPGQLDYAILVLESDIGLARLGKDLDTDFRGWMMLPRQPPPPAVGMTLWVWQHPSLADIAGDGPVQESLGIASGKVLRLLDDGLRLRHDVATRAGTSGAPCFDQDLNFVGLHNAGGYKTLGERGQAIPLCKITGDLRRKKIPRIFDSISPAAGGYGGTQRAVSSIQSDRIAEMVAHRKLQARILMDRRPEELGILYAISQGRLVHVLVCGGSDSHVDFLTRLEQLSFPCQLGGMASAAERRAFLRGDAKDLKKWEKNSLNWPPSNLPPEEALKRIQFELNDMDTSKPMYLESFVAIDSCDPARDRTLIAQLAKHCLDKKLGAARFQIFIVYYDGSPSGAGRERMSAFSWKPAQEPDGCGHWAPFMPIRAGDLSDWRSDIAAAWNVDAGTLAADIASYFPDDAAFPLSLVQKRLLPLMQNLAEQSLPKE